MSYLVSQLVEETRQALQGTYRAAYNQSVNLGTTGTTSVTLTLDHPGADAGTVLSIGSELLYVVLTVGNVCEVVRGFGGTTPAAWAAGALIEVDPRYPPSRISAALRDEIRSWPASVFRAEQLTVPIAATQRVVALSRSDILRVLECRRDPATSLGSSSYAVATTTSRDTYPRVDGTLMRTGPAQFAGWGLELTSNVPAGSLYVLAAVPFDTSVWANSIDLEDFVGLPQWMFDIPKWGAMGRLLSEDESLRVDMTSQPQPRRATEVQNGETLQAGQYFTRRRDARLREAADMFRQLYPPTGWS